MSFQVIQQTASSFMRNVTFQFNVANVSAGALGWIMANPGQTALVIVNGFVIFTPAALTGPLLATMGFGAAGPVAGSVAAWLQPIFGNVVAHGLFATLQSAAMGGYGVATVNGLAQAGAVVSGGLTALSAMLAGRGAA